jgi:bacterial leucyl aminopeptidase
MAKPTGGAPTRENAVAFFDIGDTLASVRVDPAGTRIEDMVPLPGVLDALETLRAAGVRMGIISNRGPIPAADVDAALARAGLGEFLDSTLVIYGRKDSVRIFEQAALAARSSALDPPRKLLFVGEDATERGFALAADFLVCPHPSLAPGILLAPSPLRFLRIRVPPAEAATDWRAPLRERPVVPLHVGGEAAPELYAIADTATALELDDLGFWVDRLGADDEPLTSELYLLRDDGRAEGAFGSATGSAAALFGGDDRAARRVLASTEEGLIVAVPAGRSVESLHVGSPRHGHNLKLTPLPWLVDPAAAEGLRESVASLAATALDATGLDTTELSAPEIKIVRSEVTAARLGRDVARYSGARPVRPGVTLISRHIHHPDNPRSVQALVTDLMTIGRDRLVVRTHRFSHEGLPHDNVEATLAGSGLPGVVLVTAHLDSTAARKPGYQPDRDPAPGADDNGSGVAGVLAAARAVLALDARLHVPRREFRFVLFNAEEQGLVGSRAYARDQVARGSDIVAVLQCDMIGFDALPGRTFELHAGFTPSAAVQKLSIRLAELVAAQVSRVAPALPPAQLYPSADGAPDPAEGRSDHSSFQLSGYPACLASEDFFVGPAPSSPAPDPNPNYHSPGDTVVKASYASDITRAMTAAAWLCGTR